MRSARFVSFAFAVLSVCMLGNHKAVAVTFNTSGTFTADNSFYTYSFTTTATQNYSFSTTSYGAGGFVPVLTLFSGSGKIIGSDGGDGACSGSAVKDAGTKMCDDASLSQMLAAGSYQLYLTEFPNVAIGDLADGFLFSTSPTATGDICGVDGGKFLQTDTASCVQRTGSYNLSVNSTSPVPEPATWALVLPAMAALFLVDHRRRQLL